MLRYISFLQANVAIYRDIWFIFYRQMSFQMSRHPRKGQILIGVSRDGSRWCIPVVIGWSTLSDVSGEASGAVSRWGEKGWLLGAVPPDLW